MPKVFSKNGFDCYIYTLDHQPPHVHIKYNGTEVVMGLGQSPDDIKI